MDWERSLRALAAGQKTRMRVSCKPAQDLLSRVDFPNKHFKAVHITGSKGKGSVAALISAALKDAPFSSGPVGTYGSPHVEAINERVRINGSPISDEVLASCLGQVLDARDQSPVIEDATWFDVMSIAGMQAFRLAEVDWAVVEVGMGGRLDSTNVLSAPVSVITNVYLEHAEVIGPTVEDIAYEKAGVIAPDADVILGMPLDHTLAPIFLREATTQDPPATVLSVPAQDKSLFTQNVSLARAALRCIAEREGSRIAAEELLPDKFAKSTLASFPARQELFSVGSVAVLLDGAHVPDSVAHVLEEARHSKPPIVVLGVSREKDVLGIARVIMERNPLHVFATSAGHAEPYLPANDLAASLQTVGGRQITATPEACDALHQAIDMAAETGSEVLVVGSLHLAGKVRPELRRLASG